VRAEPAGRLPVIPGTVPPPQRRPRGCRFAPRCAHSSLRCEHEVPAIEAVGPTRVACFHPAGDDRE
jgi:oligopeptide/dipeptide ABC transporter ATP-binding protein